MMERRKNLNDKFGFVDLMKIKDFIDYELPNEYIVESDRYSNGCSTPVLTAGQSFILGYTNESKGIYKKGPCIIFDDFTTSVHYVDFPFKVKSSAMKILTIKSNADLKYCYYLLLSLSKMPPNHKRQWISTTSEKNHVLPSMDRQISIVKQLDLISDTIVNYTNQIENLDNLVKARFVEMFGNPATPGDKFKTCKLGEVADVKSSHRVFSTEFVNEGVPFYRGTEISVLASGQQPEDPYRISMDHYLKIANDDSKPIRGDLLLPSICNKGQVWMVNTDEPFYYKDGRVLCISPHRSIFDSRYLQFYMKMRTEAEYPKLGSGSTFAEFKIFQLKELLVDMPPMNAQKSFCLFADQVDKSRFDIKKSIIELEREVVYD